MPVTRNKVLEERTKKWEEQQKGKFAKLCKSDSSYADVIEFALAEDKTNHKMVRINHRIRCFKNDGAYQLHLAIEKLFGTVRAQGEKGLSGEGAITTLPIRLADGTELAVPFGDIALEGLGEGAMITINYDSSDHMLTVTGKCQMRFQSLINDIIDETRKGLERNSIYKNQAVSIDDLNNPEIMDLSGTDKEMMVLSDQTKFELEPVYARLRHSQLCREHGIPLKYGVLLEGGYGTGKTLLAFKLARIAIDNNWIFIYLKDPTQFAECVRMAQVIDHSGNGCVIFVEDIDQVTRGNREAALQDILNTLDGGDTKDMNVITIFTTNHINIINPTFLRGKRVDGIISMGSLDAKTAEAFIRESFRDGNYIIQEDLTEICEFIKNSKIVPAFMAVILERVKTRLILRGQNTVMADDIRKSVVSYLHQVELAQTKDEMETPAETLYRALKGIASDKNSNLEENVRTILKATNYEWDREDPIK